MKNGSGIRFVSYDYSGLHATHGTSSSAAAGGGHPRARGTQLHGEREASSRTESPANAIPAGVDPFVKQPPISAGHVISRTGTYQRGAGGS